MLTAQSEEAARLDPSTDAFAQIRSDAYFRHLAGIAGSGVALLGFVVLAGWAFDLPALMNLHAGWVTMKANTAAGLILAGAALWLLARDERRPRLAGRVCGAVVAAIGFLTICEYILPVDLQIDQLLFREMAAVGAHPGRPSPITAAEFAMMGIALQLVRRPGRRSRRIAQALALAMMIFAYLAVIGYIYGAPALYGVGGYQSIAFHTAVALGALGAAILLLDPDRGLLRLIAGSNAGGVIARRMLPFAIVAPVLLGWLRLKAQEVGVVDTVGGVLVLVTGLVAMFVTVIIWSAWSLERLDRERGKLDEIGRLYAALKDAHQHLRILVDASPVAIIEVDRERCVSAWNPAAERLFGWRAEEVLGRTLPTVPAERLEELQRVLDVGDPNLREGPLETRRKRKDGRYIDVTLWTAPRVDKNGAVIGSIGMLADMTKQKRADENLRGLLESAPDAMVLADEQGKILRVNAMTERLFGYSRGEMLGQPVEMLIPQRFRAHHVGHRAGYHRALRARAMGSGLDLYGLRKDGSEFSLEISLSPIESDECTMVSAAIRDVSDRKQAEEQLRQLQRLQAVGQLTGGIAHEFNNLLMIVLGNAEILRGSLVDRPALRAIAERVERAADRGAELTNELLSFSRKQSLKPQSIDSGDPLKHLDLLLKPSLGEQHELSIEVERGLSPALADATQFDNALVNLIINARDAMPSGGAILVRAGNRIIDGDEAARLEVEPGRFVMFEVIDTGAGMTPDVVARAVEPFFTTKDVGKGSGLGLSMVHGFVKQSGGSMEIASEPGKGTRVRLFLPIAVGAPQVSEPAPAPYRLPGAGLTVLCVEDDPMVLMTTAEMLRELSYRVIEATDGPAALALLDRAGSIDVLFTDVIMPKAMSGVGLAREVKSRQPHVKVVYASGYSKSVIASAGIIGEDFMLLRKPYTSGALAAAMRAVAPQPAQHAARRAG